MADVKWIKVTTDVFDDEKILLIESLPSADSIITIWFKLLILAGKQNNNGVFLMSNRIPYTDEMLATIFRRELSVVRLALNTFQQFGMIEVIDDVITIPNWNKHQTLDAYDKKKERDRLYQQERREKQKLLISQKSSDTSSDTSSDVAISDIEEDKDIDKERDKDKKKRKETKPSVYFPDEVLNQTFLDYIAMRKLIKKPMSDRAIELAIKDLQKLAAIPFSDSMDNDLAIQILEQSIKNSWLGLFPLKQEKRETTTTDFIDKWRDA